VGRGAIPGSVDRVYRRLSGNCKISRGVEFQSREERMVKRDKPWLEPPEMGSGKEQVNA